MMVASLSSFSFRFCLCSVWFCFGSTGSCVTESDKHALRMLSPMISQIDIAVVKLSHDVVSGSISVACTYVDLILDIFGFFFSRHSAFVSRRFIFNETYWILSFSLSFCHSFSHTPIVCHSTTFCHLHVCQTISAPLLAKYCAPFIFKPKL